MSDYNSSFRISPGIQDPAGVQAPVSNAGPASSPATSGFHGRGVTENSDPLAPPPGRTAVADNPTPLNERVWAVAAEDDLPPLEAQPRLVRQDAFYGERRENPQ
jgi:hypothetical protein